MNGSVCKQPRVFRCTRAVTISGGCLDGNGDYLMTVPDVEPGEGYKIR